MLQAGAQLLTRPLIRGTCLHTDSKSASEHSHLYGIRSGEYAIATQGYFRDCTLCKTATYEHKCDRPEWLSNTTPWCAQ